MLGFPLASGSTTLITQMKELLRADDCPASKSLDDKAAWLMNDFEELAP